MRRKVTRLWENFRWECPHWMWATSYLSDSKRNTRASGRSKAWLREHSRRV